MFRLVLETKLIPKENSHLGLADLKVLIKPVILLLGLFLLENPDCAKNYNGDMFRIIGKARSSFHQQF